jgi:hypothetical protein
MHGTKPKTALGPDIAIIAAIVRTFIRRRVAQLKIAGLGIKNSGTCGRGGNEPSTKAEPQSGDLNLRTKPIRSTARGFKPMHLASQDIDPPNLAVTRVPARALA